MKHMRRGYGVPVEFPVRFAETDQMGVVHHSVFAVWLEAGRIAWMEATGLPYEQVAAQGFNFAVTGLSIQYRTSATFGDSVRVVTYLETLRSRQIAFTYEVRKVHGNQLLATGTTDHICVDQTGQMARIPGTILKQMRTGADQLAQLSAADQSPIST